MPLIQLRMHMQVTKYYIYTYILCACRVRLIARETHEIAEKRTDLGETGGGHFGTIFLLPFVAIPWEEPMVFSSTPSAILSSSSTLAETCHAKNVSTLSYRFSHCAWFSRHQCVRPVRCCAEQYEANSGSKMATWGGDTVTPDWNPNGYLRCGVWGMGWRNSLLGHPIWFR